MLNIYPDNMYPDNDRKKYRYIFYTFILLYYSENLDKYGKKFVLLIWPLDKNICQILGGVLESHVKCNGVSTYRINIY